MDTWHTDDERDPSAWDGAAPDRASELVDEASYVCQSCGEEIVVPVDALAGERQEYVEDCPVCCHPHLLSVRIELDGAASIVARAE